MPGWPGWPTYGMLDQSHFLPGYFQPRLDEGLAAIQEWARSRSFVMTQPLGSRVLFDTCTLIILEKLVFNVCLHAWCTDGHVSKAQDIQIDVFQSIPKVGTTLESSSILFWLATCGHASYCWMHLLVLILLPIYFLYLDHTKTIKANNRTRE